MNNKKSIIIIIISLVILLAGAGGLYKMLSEKMNPDLLAENKTEVVEQETEEFEDEAKEDSGKMQVPDFVVYDIDGNEVKLSDFRGKPVVLNFWASWCGPCKNEMPDFEEVYGEYGEDINFVMVNLTDGSRETVESASKFIEKQGYTFPVYYDTAYNATTVYGVNSVPVTYFIDEEGYGIAQGRGMLNMETIKKGIGMIYEE